MVKNGVSIHLMLLFIWEHNDEQDKKLKFQYISCCYLSQIRWCQDICNKGFNTSHVVIYHNCISRIERCLLFQYISCCYLSPAPLVCQECLNTFQYISCCYLSAKPADGLCGNLVSIHLMLLFIVVTANRKATR